LDNFFFKRKKEKEKNILSQFFVKNYQNLEIRNARQNPDDSNLSNENDSKGKKKF